MKRLEHSLALRAHKYTCLVREVPILKDVPLEVPLVTPPVLGLPFRDRSTTLVLCKQLQMLGECSRQNVIAVNGQHRMSRPAQRRDLNNISLAQETDQNMNVHFS